MSLREIKPFEEERLGWMAATFESVSDLVFIADLSDRFIYINPAALKKLGYEKHEMLGQTAEMMMTPQTIKIREEILQKTLNAPFSWTGEVSNRCKDGNKFIAHLKTALIRNKRGEAIGMVGIERDISEQKKQERLEAISVLAAGLAHEIGNPLASISSLVQLLQRKSLDSKHSEKYQAMGRHIQRINTIIHNVSDFAKKEQPKMMAVSLKPLIEVCLQRVCLEKNEKRVEIKSQFEENLPRVKAEAGQMAQVFSHLFSNAFDAIKAEGTLTVTATQTINSVLVKVQDTGCGIPKDSLEKVFEPFFTTKDVNEGKGLGLSVSYGLIQSFGGDMQIESEVGRGTTITILLPKWGG